MTDWHKPTPPTENEHGDEVHPAFGMMAVHRSSVVGGPENGAVLFDSEIAHRETITVTISPASRSRDLKHDWIHPTPKTLIEVEMSMAQWASVVSSMNTQGVPVTIRRTEQDWNVPGLEFKPRLALSAEETRKAADEAFADIKAAFATYREHKTAANLRTLEGVIRNATPNVAYAGEQLRKHTEDVVQKARADVEAMVVAHADRLGIEAPRSDRPRIERLTLIEPGTPDENGETR